MDRPYVPRMADRALSEMIDDHAAILVVGPRAAGKTTTCEHHARSRIMLTNPETATAFAAGPHSVLRDLVPPVLVDEWQEAPHSLQAIKDIVDRNSARGQFLVTGSVRGDLDAETWPGTGRLVRLTMYGLTERELEGRTDGRSWFDRALAGEPLPDHRSGGDLGDYIDRAMRSGFPEPALRVGERGRTRWLSSYVDQVVTRDAAKLSPRRDATRMRNYLHALALNSAGVVDDTTLWTSAAIAKDTARGYDALLQNLLVLDRLPAWTSNRLKRLALASKRYLVDPGLLAPLAEVDRSDVLLDGNLVGRLIETFVVAQLRAEAALMPSPPRLHHLRTAGGEHEIDVIIERGKRLLAIEIKATASPDSGDARHLRWLRREFADRPITSVLLHTGQLTTELDDGTIATPISALWH